MPRILLVDDSEDSRLLLKAVLGKSPVSVELETAENGREALARIEACRYDLVLMDMQMPVMDGFEATRELRKRERLAKGPRLSVVALSAYNRPEERKRILEAGCDAFMVKPVRKEELWELIHKVADGKFPGVRK